MATVGGTLVIADISGYTRYIAGTEHEHSEEILAELLLVISRSFDGRLRIDQLEGDALCCTTERTDEVVLGWVIECFGAFHRRLRDIRAATTCPCLACASVGDLGLKFFIHRGTFSRQQIGPAVQLFGGDVNLVHRLTKNTVPLREYVYASEPTLAGWSAARRNGFSSAPQTYDLGTVEGSYLDLADARREALREPMTRVEETGVRWHRREVLEAPIDVAWRVWTDPVLVRRRLQAERVDLVPGARGTYIGAEFHCHHSDGSSLLRIVGAEPPREMTIVTAIPGVPVAYMTDRLTELNGERTQWDCWWGWPEPEGGEAASSMGLGFLDQFAPPMIGAIHGMLAELTGRRGASASPS